MPHHNSICKWMPLCTLSLSCKSLNLFLSWWLLLHPMYANQLTIWGLHQICVDLLLHSFLLSSTTLYLSSCIAWCRASRATLHFTFSGTCVPLIITNANPARYGNATLVSQLFWGLEWCKLKVNGLHFVSVCFDNLMLSPAGSSLFKWLQVCSIMSLLVVVEVLPFFPVALHTIIFKHSLLTPLMAPEYVMTINFDRSRQILSPESFYW